jgi:hypothetical protein
MGRPGIITLQRWVSLTWLPSGKFNINYFVAGQMFLTGVSSVMNMDVAPVSGIACDVAIVIALRYWGVGVPNRCLAVACPKLKASKDYLN